MPALGLSLSLPTQPVLSGPIGPPPSGSTYYVSSAGSDSNNGTSTGSPWKTLAKVNAHAFTPGSTINFRGGDIFYGQLTNASSGTSGNPITYQSYGTGNATISGGTPVTGWSIYNAAANIWSASLSASLGRPRNLWCAGLRVVRSRTYGGLPSGTVLSGAVWDTSASSNPGYLSGYANPADIELVFQYQYTLSRIPISSISGDSITMVSLAWSNMAYIVAGQTTPVTWVENAFEIFTANGYPGTFYHNRTTNTVYMIPPLTVTNPNNVLTVAPEQQQILAFGSALSYVSFTGLNFSHTTSLQPSSSDGMVVAQANAMVQGGALPANDAYVPEIAAAEINGGTGVSFILNVFENLGTAGLQITGSSSGCEVAGNILSDISGNGIIVGDSANYASNAPIDINIHSNLIRYCGVEFLAGCGILNFYSTSLLLNYNQIHDIGYTGISTGWGWGRESPSANTGNVVNMNIVYKTMQAGLNDGGGIYSNGYQNGQQITNNLVYLTGLSGQSSGILAALYGDNGTLGVTWNGNVFYEAAGIYGCLLNEIANNNTFENTTCDGGSVTVTSQGSPNSITQPSEVGLTAAMAAGVALGAGIESQYSQILDGDAPVAQAFFTDLLAAGQGADLVLHTSNSNHAWVNDVGYTGVLETLNNGLLAPSGSQYITNWAPGSVDYWAQGTIALNSANITNDFHLGLRDASSGYCYLMGYQNSNGTERFIIYRVNGAGAYLQVTANGSFPLTPGNQYWFRAFVVGSNLRVVVEGTEVLNTTDSALTSGTLAAVANYGSGSVATNPVLTNLFACVVQYIFIGPSSGTHGVPSQSFTVQPLYGAKFDGTRTVTISDGGAGGLFTPSIGLPATGSVTVTPNAGDVNFAFTYTPVTAGNITLTPTNGQNWQDAAPLVYQST